MRMMMITTYPPQECGVGIYAANLVAAIKKHGHKIIIVANKPCNADYIIDFKSNSLFEDISKIILKEKIDVINIQYQAVLFSNLMNKNLIELLKKVRIPTIVTLHEVQYKIRSPNILRSVKLKALELMEKKVIQYSTAVIVHTPKQEEYLRRRSRTDKVRFIPHGLELKNIVSTNGRNLLFFGIITPSKGLEYLLYAMKILKDYNLTIAGNFPKGYKKYRAKLEHIIRSNEIGNVLTSFAWIEQDKKWDYFNKADVLVLPYLWAPYQSGVLHNAISCGLPVVVTKVGALYEMVEKFQIGEIADPSNVRSLVRAIKRVISNKKHYTLGINTYRKLANWNKVAIEHVKLFDELINLNS
jgi:glycosyltransferase involved in cell wall biosynthesis